LGEDPQRLVLVGGKRRHDLQRHRSESVLIIHGGTCPIGCRRICPKIGSASHYWPARRRIKITAGPKAAAVGAIASGSQVSTISAISQRIGQGASPIRLSAGR
jgi:hypothetical protein